MYDGRSLDPALGGCNTSLSARLISLSLTALGGNTSSFQTGIPQFRAHSLSSTARHLITTLFVPSSVSASPLKKKTKQSLAPHNGRFLPFRCFYSKIRTAALFTRTPFLAFELETDNISICTDTDIVHVEESSPSHLPKLFFSAHSTKKVKHKVANVLWLPHRVVSGMIMTLPLTLGIVNVY